MTQPQLYAVLTGDIVKSSRLTSPQLASVRSTLVGAVESASHWKRGLVKGKPEFYRGDAWQLLLAQPAMALRFGLFLRASLLAQGLVDTRISIGLGAAASISARKISLSTGQAFVLSGHALDEMTRYSRLAVRLPDTAGPLAAWLPVTAHLCDALIRQWTRRQAELVCAALHPSAPSHEAIALSLKRPVSKQTVTKSLDGANWYVLREALQLFERAPWQSLLSAA
jgi:hypothetical protein